MKAHVILGIFKRNFYSYFSNPTGYVFICGFVLMTGFAAFWPHEFFNANLANLDQLNELMPLILLGFVPAITMSIWADERRQGTDELLLTLAASDLDVVAGKYLAASAIFTVSLLFSLSNIVVLSLLGEPDIGLMLTTYIGYWMMGLTMLSIGMVASFLTSNLTVGFVLGVAFNTPLIFAASADVVVTSSDVVQWLHRWSIPAKFEDFARGVVSLSSVTYFVSIIAVMLYLSMILIGRRHWNTGGGGRVNAGAHYAARVASMGLVVVGLALCLRVLDMRVDASSEGLSSLSPRTLMLLDGLGDKRRVHIEAYVSPEDEVPEAYIQTRLNLLTMLDELQKRSGGKVTVRVNETESFKEDAAVAEQRFGITGQRVFTRDRGRFREAEIFLGVAVTSGLDKVVIPFVDRGIPVEYELVRSIVALAQKDRKTVGVVTTDAQLMGGFDPQTMSQTPGQAIITELEKQYNVKQINPSEPIKQHYDVMLLVQPSTLEPAQLDNVLDAIRDGQPTAIFEDPQPFVSRNIAGTDQPRQPPQQNPFMRPPPPKPKGNINKLWQLLGVMFDGGNVVWQDYNPYPKADNFPNEFVFVGPASGQSEAFNTSDPITSGLQQTLLLCPGSVTKANNSILTFEPLLQTGKRTGTVAVNELFMPSFFGGGGGLNPDRRLHITEQSYTLAARITGTPRVADSDAKSDAGKDGDKAADDKSKPAAINAVLFADIDVLSDVFFNIRSQGPNPDMDLYLDVDNVTLVLNTIDSLAGDDRFIDIRKRRHEHRTLTAFERIAEQERLLAKKARQEYREDFTKAIEQEQDKINDRVDKIRKTPGIDQREFDIQLETARSQLEKSLSVKRLQLEQERDRRIQQAESEMELHIRRVQNRIKRLAVFLPPILPLGIGLFIFIKRRSGELEGAVRSRVRS